MDFVEKVGWQGWRLYLLLLFTSITVTATGQNCDVDFPGTALRSFSTTCGGVSSANLTLGKTVNMGDGDVFTFDRPVINIFGNLHVDARGNGKIVVPVGVTVNVWNNFKLDAKNSGCSAANPCTFEIEVNGTLNLFDDFDNSLVTIVWTGTGNVVVGDNFKNSSNGCMACGAGGCPGFDVDPGKCDDDGSGCPVSDFCALIDDRCSTDVTDPVITACPDRVVNLAGPGCTQIVTWPPPDATDNCVISSLVPNYPSGTAFPKGITTVQYTATDGAGNTATCSFIVNVVDTRPPEITSCPANITVIANASCQAMATWEPPSLGNNCSGATLNSDRTPGSIFQLGRTRVTYTATSPNGQSSCSFDVTVVDDSAPVVTSCEDVIVDAGPDCWTNVSWTLPSTSDCNEVQLVSTHSPGDSFPFGSSEVSYTFRDVAGNTSTCNFQVVVKNEKQPTVANCPNDIMIEADDLGFAMATWTEPTATAACGQLSVSRSHTPGQSFPIGTTAVSYTIADDHSNKTVCNFYVIVSPAKIDVEVGRAITPDGNNVNDYLEIVNIEKYKNNSIVIVDRWGGIIYKASGYDNNKTAWTGMNLHGGAVPTGTYFYTLSISNGDEKVQKTGFIELVR